MKLAELRGSMTQEELAKKLNVSFFANSFVLEPRNSANFIVSPLCI